MFEIESFPDFIIHAQCRLETTDPLPVGARRMGTIDLFGLSFYERPDIAARFGLILCATLQPVPGLVFQFLDHRARTEPARAEDLALRYDIHRLLCVSLQNVSGAPLDLGAGAVLTVAGIAGAVTPADFNPTLGPDAGAQSGPLRAVSLAGVVLSQHWQNLP